VQSTTMILPEIKLSGITTRTNNAHILESDPSTNRIAATVHKYFSAPIPLEIAYRKKPHTTYCVYAQYESDWRGDYTFFIGEEVESFIDMPESLKALIIPSQTYIKFTSDPGPMPEVCINLWKKIWQMTTQDLGGKRSYIADFEVYDERASDNQSVILDIYIGITNP
jgi:predicted transcriptional regulator YdeE